MNKNILAISVFALLLGACSSGDSRDSAGPRKMEKEVQVKLQAINEELAIQSIPEERKQQLKLDKAKILLDHDNYDEAAVLLKEVLRAKNEAVSQSEVNLYLGKAYYGKSDYSNAISYLSTSERLDRNYNDHERKKLVARSLYEEKEYYPALAALSKAYKGPETPKDHFYYETAARTYYKMGFHNKSVDFYKKGLHVAELGLKEYPGSETLRAIQSDCLKVLEPNK
ncbi:tetratricopeptide repeat protein [Leptospira sp. GIMC2001]|uniref:tetratricopeptide repeat protein n=1 Tax=Leptospira sp. GIMC2001 TaxID=1513297 RepID=UPI00234A584F|nr:tetratricopeptide repeat protein [Leptospira sp. GIMC2001]WCL51172.1 tetratricopeptide repeat protein [Leptospira sp. GIMC2001]